jgi:D-alanyl-D-alanine carboxypeptidase
VKAPLATLLSQGLRRTWRILPLAVVVLLVGTLCPFTVSGQEVPELQINSRDYIVIDATTGEIFAQRGAHEHRAPASLTKVFTAIEAIESAPPDREVVTAESDMVSDMASQVGFGPGETFTVEDLLYGMMLPSGNDAARALARSLGAEPGDSDEQATARFMARMNQRLKNMGLTDTQLLDPDGWGIPGHYSSAYDLAAFIMFALRYPRFVQAFSTLEYETPDGEYEFENNNRMLRSYDGIIGGKTGYDDDAGWCLINVAQRDGNTMIAVTLDGFAPDDWYDDNRVLLNYAFEQKALQQEQGLGVTGEVVRYRDPDAATILAMGSAGSAVGPAQLAAPAPAAAPQERPMAAPAPAAVPTAIAAPAPVPTPASPPANNAGLLVAALVAAVLIAIHGVSAWRLVSRRTRAMPPGGAGQMPRIASRSLAESAAASPSD